MKLIFVGYLLILCSVLGLVTQVIVKAEPEEEQEFLPTNINIAITVLSSMLAVGLFVISYLAYRTDRRTRFLFVMAAFFLFAVKGVLIALDDLNRLGVLSGFLGEVVQNFSGVLKTLSGLIDFGVLILFSLGLLRK